MPGQSQNSQRKYFLKILQDAGVILSDHDGPHIITKQQSLVVRDIEVSLTEDPRYPHNITDFIHGLTATEHIKSLQPTELRTVTDSESEWVESQESLLRILLNIECLQKQVMDNLLDKLLELASEENDEDIVELRLILKNLFYLPFINDVSEFAEKLLGVVDVAYTAAQLEILLVLPDLLPANGCDEPTAKQLCRLLEEYDLLAGVIVDDLSYFDLSVDVKKRIETFIIEKMLTTSRYFKIYPLLFQFLILKCDDASLLGILLNTHKALDNLMGREDDNPDIKSYKAMMFDRLEVLVLARKNLHDLFVAMINSFQLSEDHKPVDILILIILYKSFRKKKHLIEAVVKKRIKHKLLLPSLFEKLFETYFVQQSFDYCIEPFISLCTFLFETPDCIDHVALIFKLLFTHPLCSVIQRQELLFNLMVMGHGNSITYTLNILNNMMEEPLLKEHRAQLMAYFRHINSMDLKAVKMLFEVLCYLNCRPENNDASLKDELAIIVRKQVSSFRDDIKQRGIISSVVMAKHLASVSEEHETNEDDVIENITDIKSASAKEAAQILQYTSKRAEGMPEMLSLYYDELSAMVVSKSHLDPEFLSWLFESITGKFQQIFVVEAVPDPVDDIKLTSQYCLNSNEETEQFIAVNVGELSLKSRNILILSPLFRLLRLLHHRKNSGDLETIDALLGCPIIMPSVFTIDDLSIEQTKNVADSIYHCINWFRELISAFVSQTSKKIRTKVVARLLELIHLQELLDDCMTRIPEHELPCGIMDAFVHTTKRSPKKSDKPPSRKRKKDNDTSIACTSISQPNKVIDKKKKGPKGMISYKFRELDTDILILLKYPLNIDENTMNVEDIVSQGYKQIKLHIKQFQLILEDFIWKLEAMTIRKHQDLSLSHLNTVDVVSLITDCKKLVPNIHLQSLVIVNKIKSTLEEADNCHDAAALFTEECNDLKRSYGLVLKFYSVIFNWTGFQNTKHHPLLTDYLKAFQSPTQQSQTLVNPRKVYGDFIKKLTDTADQCLQLASAVAMIEILQSLRNTHLGDQLNAIVTTSELFLKRQWYNTSGKPETGKTAFENLNHLIKASLTTTDVKKICTIVGSLQTEAETLKLKNDSLAAYKSIDKASFHVLFGNLCIALNDRVKVEVSALTNSEHLTLWRTVMLTLQGLMTIVKIQTSKNNQQNFLKKSIAILKTFLSHGMPIMEIMLKSKPEKVVEILKIMQNSTRFLHALCCDSKAKKAKGLVSSVPHFRLTLETLLYKVKGMLVANGCPDAFWMGNLKNKNLDGEVILSQSTMCDTVADDEEELQLDSDDDCVTIAPSARSDDVESEVFDLDIN